MAHAERALTLPPRSENDDDPQIAALLSQTKAKLAMLPNMYRNMANVPGLLETYLFGYDAFRSSSGLTPVEQETVLLAISVENGCNYCVAAHSTIADMSRVPAAITDALRSGDVLPETRLEALASFTRAMVSTRGLPTSEQIQTFLDAGYGEVDILQILLAIAVKTISNYSNHLFHTDIDPAFAARTWEG